MSEPQKAKDGKRRRIKGEALGELRTAAKRYQKAQRALAKKREDILDELDRSLDQVPNWQTRAVYDRIPQKNGQSMGAEEDHKPVLIGYLPVEASKAQRKEVAEVEQAYAELEEMVERLALKLGCLPQDINADTGEITGGAVVGVDPDADAGEIAALMDFDASDPESVDASTDSAGKLKSDDPFGG